MESVDSPSFFASLVAGAIAGTTVDVVLFPLDTLKTRLQSQQGFLKAGGFKKIYSGVASAALGSAPTSALFFCTYEGVKQFVGPVMPSLMTPLVHSIAAACGEVVRICFAVEAACTLRVPVEVVKQRTQANHDMSSWRTFKSVLHIENMFANPDSSVTWQAAVCGAISGGIAGGLTTPLDVAKTRIILAERTSHLADGSMYAALKTVWHEKGLPGLFSGVTPRVVSLSVGGFIFLGAYEQAKQLFYNFFPPSSRMTSLTYTPVMTTSRKQNLTDLSEPTSFSKTAT
ncbi:mitochondrial S-adenosylmethionine carrier protein-like isoform X4 [Dermacentor andersoni]|uniref:mitochondrial S-adenosylmethionine carrier protein-like isoform X4 n=1 Tax=Dermacentor andersoni TaxID=34620 RepID=UPI002417C20E|nr:S-adenosylmethionine mitochondrial carrier protein-like isoform X4 [Dermacentor andersoni]